MRHHYIPCFYTSRWTGEDMRLCQYSRPHTVVKAKRVYPAGTGYQDDLWVIPQVPADKAHLIETRFMLRIDQKASDALTKIEQGKFVDLMQEERWFWATFLVSLMQRTPQKVTELKDDAHAILEENLTKLRDKYEDGRTPSDPPTFDEWLKVVKTSGNFEQIKVLLLQDAILLPNTTRFICNLHWGLCQLNKNSHRLLTSDRPVIMSNGLLAPDDHIAIPIGPRKLFIASRSSQMGQELIQRRNLSETLNDLIVRQAQTYVYGIDDSQLRFVEKRLRRVT